MKITVLDMDTAAIDGDVSLGALEELGEVKIFGKTGREDTAELIGDADAVICNKTRMTREVMQSCPNLRYVGLMGTGFDQVDIKAADELGITVCNVPAYSSDAVAQHAFALILNYFGSISGYTADCASGDWTEKKYLSAFGRPMHELAGKTIGLIGCGGIDHHKNDNQTYNQTYHQTHDQTYHYNHHNYFHDNNDDNHYHHNHYHHNHHNCFHQKRACCLPTIFCSWRTIFRTARPTRKPLLTKQN